MTMQEPAVHILLVDDEPSIHEPLSDYLRQNGYEVTVAERVAAAREKLDELPIALILLDIMMPGEDGLSMTRQVRAQSTTPIILLTAKAEETDRIVGLEMGADDYLVKPFNPRELLARIKAVLRRVQPAAPTNEDVRYHFAGFCLDESARTLVDADGQQIVLTGGEFAMLQALAERAGRVLNRDQLLDITQGREAGVFDRAVDNQVSRLRKKIEPDPKVPTIIKTVRGGGYVLAAKVSKT